MGAIRFEQTLGQAGSGRDRSGSQDLDSKNERDTVYRRDPRPLVVVLDDDAGYAAELKHTIKLLGYRARSFRDLDSFFAAGEWLTDASCIIMDVKFGGAPIITLLPKITKVLPFAAPVVVTACTDAKTAVRAMKQGVVDYLERPAPQSELSEALQTADLRATRLMRVHANVTSAHQRLSRLTQRQLEIVRYIAHGFTSKEIGAKLEISYRTVETHRSWIMDRLEVGSLADLVHLYFQACPEDAAAKVT